uniref:Thymidylate synthase n=1 Tax=Ochrobactrum phage ORM_20 TaxID=2985243 RepID=A0A9N6WZV6_9VIRU|nr:thymidylate synthase [Ochrobactrum phage ORM_20]
MKNTTRIEANIIEYSQHPQIPELKICTFELVYPYVVHAEVMTHRQFSRNAASFRAVPTNVFIDEVIKTPYMPIHWGKNQKGMQAHEEQNVPVTVSWDYYDFENDRQYSETKTMSRERAWLAARDEAVRYAKAFGDAGYHKQVVNRLLAPYVHMRTVLTSTHWANFDALRRHEDAEPIIRALADKMYEARMSTTPRILQEGEWHIPYTTQEEKDTLPLDVLKKISAERSARVSYKLRDNSGRPYDPDFTLYKQLVESFPIHASPIEHQATPDYFDVTEKLYGRSPWKNEKLHGNFTGFIQNRKTIEGEAVIEDYDILLKV